MEALILDAGNTCLKAALYAGPRQLPRLGQGHASGLRPAEPLTILEEVRTPGDLQDEETRRVFLADVRKIRTARPQAPLALVSVVPQVSQVLRAEFPDLFCVSHTSRLPFSLAITEPAAVGPDRLSNMAAAVSAGLNDALVVDAGTATTFDVLLGGVFSGGLIAPGMGLAAAELGRQAALLQPVAFGPVPLELGTETRTAMAAGAWFTGIGGVGSTIEALRQRLGPIPVVLTGGLGHHLKSLNEAWYHDPHWTFRGTAYLLEQQHTT